MKSPLFRYLGLLLSVITISFAQYPNAPVQYIFMQGNNINTVIGTNGIFNYDKITFSSATAGFIWPATGIQRLTAVYASGLWIGAKVGPQRELRLAASWFDSHYSPGNIPVIGQVPSSSVCSDPSWRGYYVQLTDPSLFNGGTRYKTAGGRQYTFNYDSWANWPVAKGAPYVEVNGIPGYQPEWNGDRPGIGNGMTARPEEISFVVFMDYSNCTNQIHFSALAQPGGTLPLGVEVHQISFMFNCNPLRDVLFTKYRIINKSALSWDSVYISNLNDMDLGESIDDLMGCDSLRNLSFQLNGDNDDPVYGANPPAVGTRVLQSPIRFTGNLNDTAKLPYDTLAGYKLTGLTAYNSFMGGGNECTGDPDEAFRAYYFMKGTNGCNEPLINFATGNQTRFRYSGDACHRTGWYDSIPGDKRTISSMGPTSMNIGDTQIILLSYMITRDGGTNLQNVCALQSISDSALKYYYNDFKTCVPIGIEPISSEIPQRYELLQNYPNPFNPVTKLRFNIPLLRGVAEGRGVLLKVYDVLGKEIVVIVNENLRAGMYEIEWDASNIPSGVYFYSLITNEFTQTKKMVVLK
ncbi:MAG: T9SS type A sorting domain-containing protein [Ignavibacteria bacterium]|nr:T9SS type A sorting domain-containing protein [Ignavibacteria bacterium]